MKNNIEKNKQKDDNKELIQRQYLTFQLGEDILGIDLIQSKEIIKPRKTTNIPNSADFILGIINLRGQLVTVLNLKERLNIKETSDKDEGKKRIIIINSNDALVGLLVDSVEGVVNVNDEEIEKVSMSDEAIKDEYIKGVAKLEEKLILIIDLDKLIFKNR